MREQRRVLRQPRPIHSIEDKIGKLRNRGMTKMLAAAKNSAKQDRRIH